MNKQEKDDWYFQRVLDADRALAAFDRDGDPEELEYLAHRVDECLSDALARGDEMVLRLRAHYGGWRGKGMLRKLQFTPGAPEYVGPHLTTPPPPGQRALDAPVRIVAT